MKTFYCIDILEKYEGSNIIAKIEFTKGTESFRKYGQFVCGYIQGIDTKESIGDIIRENIKYTGQVLKIGLRLTAGGKQIYKISDEKEKQLLEEGFLCSDIKEILPHNKSK